MKGKAVSLMFLFLIGFIGLSLVGCATEPTAASKSLPEMLSDAGFSPYVANTPQRKAYLESCPKNLLMVQEKKGAVCYAFTEPNSNTVYIGDQAAYWRLKQKLSSQEQSIQEQRIESDPQFWNMWVDSQGGGG